MKKNYATILAILLGLSMNVFSQVEYVLKQVIIANGGLFETEEPTDFVTVASFDPQTGLTTTFDTIYTQSVQCIIVDEKKAYVAAQDSVILYDLDSHERIAATKVGGVNQLATYHDYLIVGRQYPATNKYVKIYNKNDLSEVIAFDNISGDTYGITIDNDTANIAVNGGWAGTSGSIVRIKLDAETPEFIEELELGEQAMGIAQLFNYNNVIYSVNKTPWGGTVGSITEYHMLTRQVTSTTIDLLIGNGIDLVEGQLYVQLNGNIGSFDVETKEFTTDIIVDASETLDILSATYDQFAEQFYVNYSSYFSAGEGKVFDLEGNEVDSYEVGISAEAIALDYRLVGSVNNLIENEVKINAYPNPFTSELNLNADEIIENIQIFDITGKIVSTIQNVNSQRVKIIVSDLKQGLYIINVETRKGNVSKRIIKK